MLLSLDTSTRRIGIALYDGAQIVNEMAWGSAFHHTTELAPAVDRALQRAGITPADLQAIGVAVGPGSYTALRIGLAFAKGLALPRGLPLIGINSLDVLAASQLPGTGGLAAVLEAGRTRLALGWYAYRDGGWQPDGDAHLTTADQLAKTAPPQTRVTGELSAEARNMLGATANIELASPARSLRRPAYLAELAWARFQNGESDPPETLSPIYLAQEN